MQTLYPGASVKMFSGTGHAAPFLRSDEYHATIEAFVSDSAGSRHPGRDFDVAR